MALTVLIAATPGITPAKSDHTSDEAEIRRIHADLDRALVAGDGAAFERMFADDYFFSHHFGYKVSRAENLAYLSLPSSARDLEVLEATSDDIDVQVVGDVAYLTAAWRTVVRAKGDADAIRHVDTGRYTGIYERRDGRWWLTRDHLSEAMHDPAQMEGEVSEAGLAYLDLLKSLHSGASHPMLVKAGLIRRLDRTLAEDFVYVDPKGRLHTRADELAAYRDLQATIEKAEVLDRQVRALGNTHAVEDITVRYVGKHGDRPYDITKRSTLIWAWRGLRWQLASDHSTILTE